MSAIAEKCAGLPYMLQSQIELLSDFGVSLPNSNEGICYDIIIGIK